MDVSFCFLWVICYMAAADEMTITKIYGQFGPITVYDESNDNEGGINNEKNDDLHRSSL